MNNHPPKVAQWIISLLIRSGNRQTLLGDLEEEYHYIRGEQGKIRSDLWYVGQIFMPLTDFLRSSILWSIVMWHNYLKTAVRNIKKHRMFTMINISGLAIGLACCLLLAIYIHSELSFDSYHLKKERIFRVCEELSFNNFNSRQSGTNGVIAAALKNTYPEVEEAIRIRSKRTSMIYQDKQFTGRFAFIDKSVFSVFTWPLLKGDPETALDAPFSIVLTKETAQKYFAGDDAIGKIVTLDEDQNYTVTGIMADIPRYSTLRFDGLCSFSTLYYGNIMQPRILTDWTSHNFNTYILLRRGVNYLEFQKKIKDIYYDYVAEELAASGSSYSVFLQPIKEIYLKPLRGELGPITYVYIFGAVAVFILLIACVNFMNLSTARSMTRATEVGVRKVLGANRSRLIKQFLTEALLLSSIAMFIAIGITFFLLPPISDYAQRNLLSDLQEINWLLPGLIIGTIVVGLLAGSYPAIILSRFQAILVIKNRLSTPKASAAFRRVLVISQFIISITLIIGTALVIQQLNYLRNKDAGFDKVRIVCIPVRDEIVRARVPALRNKIIQLPEVVNAGASSSLPSWGGPMNSKIPQGYTEENTQLMQEINVDENFLATVGIRLIAGRNFSSSYGDDPDNSVIINETAAKRYGWENPIGKTIRTINIDVQDELEYEDRTVIGVVNDFHLSSLTTEIRPVYIGNALEYPYEYGKFHVMAVRVKPGDMRAKIEKLERIWKETFPDKPFDYYFLDDEFNEQFIPIERSRDILFYFTILAIVIACLGLFGMVAYAAEKRTKEIGIRKTLGSSIMQIVTLLSRELITLVLVANVVAYPLAYLLTSRWLANFPYRVDINLYTFLGSTLLALLISFITISYQSVKAAKANPVDALKYE